MTTGRKTQDIVKAGILQLADIQYIDKFDSSGSLRQLKPDAVAILKTVAAAADSAERCRLVMLAILEHKPMQAQDEKSIKSALSIASGFSMKDINASLRALTEEKKDAQVQATIDAAHNDYDEMVVEMNVNHSETMLGGRNTVIRRKRSPLGGYEFELFRPKELAGIYLSDKWQTGVDGRGNPIFDDKLTAWRKHAKHNLYGGGVDFLPLRPDEQPDEQSDIPADQRVLNLWSGFSTEAAAGGTWERIDWHIKHILAGGDTDVYNYILDWCAYSIQNPARQAGSVLVFRGDKRIGKGIFAHFLANLWGNHGKAISNGEHLNGKFNGHLSDCCLLFADEAFFPGDKKHEGVLKALITEPKLMIERKGLDPVSMPNYLKIVMATNAGWAVPTSGDDARYCVCDVSSEKKGDQAYFASLLKECDDVDARAAFLADMLERDLSGYHPGHSIPRTDALSDQIQSSLPPVWQWWLDCLEDELRAVIDGEAVSLSGEVLGATLYKHYLSWCDRMRLGEYNRLTRKGWGKEFGSLYHKKRTSSGFKHVVGEYPIAKAAAYGHLGLNLS